MGIVLEKFSENESVGDVWGKCPDTVPEWHNRNLVTLTNKGIENNNKTANISTFQYKEILFYIVYLDSLHCLKN